MALRFLNNLAINGTGTVLDVQGTQGQLFSVTDSLTGDLFSVSDISGVPILNVNSSGAITLDGYIPDNNKLNLGNSNDLQIYHDGSNSYITEAGTGDLIITADNDLLFKDGSGNTMANMNAANSVELYFGNAKKFETVTGGVLVTGELEATTLDINGNANISGTLAGLTSINSTNFIIGGHTINDVDAASEVSNADDHLMTALAIKNKIEDYGYGTSNLAIGTTSSTAMAGNTTIPSAYTHPTNLAGDDINVDTGALTGAVVISDLDFNITTNTAGHVTDANGTVATRTLTLANLGYTGATDANKYVLPTNLAGDDISVDTGALTGAVVISDLDFNVTTNSSGLVTDANGTVATRTLTLANLGYTGATNATADQTVTNSTSTTSSTTVASATAVKAAYDRGTTGVTNAASAQTTANAALPKAGGTMSGAIAMGNQNITGAGTIAAATTITAGTTFISDAVSATNGNPGADNVWVSGYGMIGNRDQLYFTNAGNKLVFGVGGVHNAQNKLIISGATSNFYNNIHSVGTITGTTLTGTSIVLDGNTITGVDDSGEFTDNDAHIMTSAAVNDRIQASIIANTDTQDLSINGTTLSLTNSPDITIPQRAVSTSVTSTSTTVAGTSSAVKSAYDRGTTGITNAASAQTTANAALPKAGGTMSVEL